MLNFDFLNVKVGRNEWWRYLLTLILFFTLGLVLTSFIGAWAASCIPWTVPQDINELLNKENIISNIFWLLFLFVLVYIVHKRSPKTIITAHKHFQWHNLGKGLLIGFIVLSISSIISYLMDPTDYEWTFNTNTFGLLVIAALTKIPFTAFLEEVLGRGYLLQAFSSITKRPIILILATSTIFGLLHYGNGFNTTDSIWCIISAGIYGLTFCVIILGEDGLETAIGLHIITNLFIALIVNSTDLWGDLPSLWSLYDSSSSELIDPLSEMVSYIQTTIVQIGVMLLTWLLVFWGRFHVLKDIFSLKKIS